MTSIDDLHLRFPVEVGGRSWIARTTVRLFDLAVASVGLVILVPLMGVVAILVKATSRGPVLYSSPRVGQSGTEFEAIKFRSMRINADQLLGELLATSREAQREYERYFKLMDDPRVTPIGGFLRQSSLDELPQLINVFRGEMSIVGPRPKLPEEREVYGPALPIVLQVKPGLTGLWQVSGRSMLSMRDRVVLDLQYASTRTLFGDFLICCKTFVQLWRPKKYGAC